MEHKFKVPVTHAQELVKTIRLLAKRGRDPFTRYLYTPLAHAGWQSSQHEQSVRKLMERIALESEEQSYLHTIAPRCKRLVSYAMEENLSVLGDASIFFLEKMQMHTAISASPESIEFSSIITEPLSEFQKDNSNMSETLFKEALCGVDTNILKSALEPIRLQSEAEKVRIDTEIKRLYDNILIASKYNNLPKCRKLLSNYIISYSDNEDYSRQDVDRLTDALEKRTEGFGQELKQMIAIELYYRITQAVLHSDISGAVQGIRKYGYIFEGAPDTMHFFDIDRLERILYQMITEKKLWNDLKK